MQQPVVKIKHTLMTSRHILMTSPMIEAMGEARVETVIVRGGEGQTEHNFATTHRPCLPGNAWVSLCIKSHNCKAFALQ